ncbi:hypothetical protein PUN28_008137 [Cardiocondyla obscurior]
MVDFGYDISDFTGVDPIYGTLDDFKKLVARAKELGLKVVLDIVPNHSSDQHEWFKKALSGDQKYKDYYVWADGKNKDDKTPPNNWISVFDGPAWTYVDAVKQWYLHQFDPRQPDLNFYNSDVQAEMIKVLKFWLDLGIDGFRVDSAAFIFEDERLLDEPRSNIQGLTSRNYNFLRHIYTFDLSANYKLFEEWRNFADVYSDTNDQDQKMMVIEAYTDLDHTIEYYKYNVLPFNFKFIRNLTAASTANDYKREMDEWMNSMPKGEVANWVLGNHDNPRVASRFPGKSDHLTMLSMILPGMTVTYNGDEIGMVDKRDISWENTQDPQACNAGQENYRNISRDPERTPFQWDSTKNAGFSKADSTWLPVNKNYKKLNLAKQVKARRSHYKLYKTLALMHHKEPALTEGSYKSFVANDNSVLGVIRSNGCRTVLYLLNFTKKSQTLNLSGEGLPSLLVVKASDVDSNVKTSKLVNVDKIRLPAKAAVLYTSL